MEESTNTPPLELPVKNISFPGMAQFLIFRRSRTLFCFPCSRIGILATSLSKVPDANWNVAGQIESFLGGSGSIWTSF
jgi:hypothetical protein